MSNTWPSQRALLVLFKEGQLVSIVEGDNATYPKQHFILLETTLPSPFPKTTQLMFSNSYYPTRFFKEKLAKVAWEP
jgi:hypothetical protein